MAGFAIGVACYAHIPTTSVHPCLQIVKCALVSLQSVKYPDVVIVVSHDLLREFWKKHNQAETPLRAWYDAVTAADWKHFQDVKALFGKTDRAAQFTVFDIGGNK